MNSPSSSKAVKTSKAPAPVGPYNQAIVAGEYLFCSGQIALDPLTGEMVGSGSIQEETHQVLKNLIAVLEEADVKSTNVVKTTIYLADLGDFNEVNKIYSEFFGSGISPARACVEVAALPKAALIEIDCIALIS